MKILHDLGVRSQAYISHTKCEFIPGENLSRGVCMCVYYERARIPHDGFFKTASSNLYKASKYNYGDKLTLSPSETMQVLREKVSVVYLYVQCVFLGLKLESFK